MTNAFAKLSPAELDRLAIVQQECGKVISAIGQVMCMGYAANLNNGGDNRRMLEIKLGGLFAALDILRERADVDIREISLAATDRKRALRRYA